MANTPLETIMDFLVGIGILTRYGDVPMDAFLPGVQVDKGELVVDPERLLWPGDLLHEAGHIAVTPAPHRIAMNDALDSAEAAAHGGEVAAIAWSWAALVHLGLPADLLFHEGGYRGRAAGLRLSFEMGVYPGAFALAEAGMTRAGDPAAAGPPYPHMQRWLRR